MARMIGPMMVCASNNCGGHKTYGDYEYNHDSSEYSRFYACGNRIGISCGVNDPAYWNIG